MPDDTRDIAIDTRAEVRGLREEFRNFVDETKEHRIALQSKIEGYDGIVNQGKGAWWSIGIIGAASGWFGAHLPSIGNIFK